MPTDYWLSKLLYDLQGPLGAEYRADRSAVIARYPVSDDVRRALLDDDLATLAPLVNPYLLRYYFSASGMNDEEFLKRMHAYVPAETTRG